MTGNECPAPREAPLDRAADLRADDVAGPAPPVHLHGVSDDTVLDADLAVLDVDFGTCFVPDDTVLDADLVDLDVCYVDSFIPDVDGFVPDIALFVPDVDLIVLDEALDPEVVAWMNARRAL